MMLTREEKLSRKRALQNLGPYSHDPENPRLKFTIFGRHLELGLFSLDIFSPEKN
jgi:hypothetical protein